jgi:hypothetical protein
MNARVTALLITCLALGTATGCGERSEPTSVTETDSSSIVLAGRPYASDLCIYEAVATGAFSKVGLKVLIEVPVSKSAPLEMLGNGRADFAITAPAELLAERDGGAPYLSVAALTVAPLDVLPKPGSHPGAQPLIVAATKDTLAKHGSITRRLLQTIGRACDVPAGSLKVGGHAPVAARRAEPAAPSVASAPARRQGVGGHPWGWQNPAEWSLLMTRLKMRGILKQPLSVDLVYTNEFLAGEGL